MGYWSTLSSMLGILIVESRTKSQEPRLKNSAKLNEIPPVSG
jgi:hypothetical protein